MHMKRRDVLKMIPMSMVGMSGFSGFGMMGQGDAASKEGKPLVAQVRVHNGTPTLFLDGRPAFAGMC